MDDKVSRRTKLGVFRRLKSRGRQLWPFLRAQKRTVLTCFLLLCMLVLLFALVSQLRAPVIDTQPAGETSVDYSAFLSQIRAGNVEAVVIQGDNVHGLLVQPLTQPLTSATTLPNVDQKQLLASNDYNTWLHMLQARDSALGSTPQLNAARSSYSHIPTGGNQSLLALLAERHVVINTLSAVPPFAWWPFLWHSAPWLALMLFFVFIALLRNSARPTNSTDGRMSQLGKSRARLSGHVPDAGSAQGRKAGAPTVSSLMGRADKSPAPRLNIPQVTFADVAGIDEVRAELVEIVQFLQTPERFERLGARIPRGALLVGPPGTGKTLLAKAVAGEAGVPFFSMSASEFVEMFVGVGASRVRDLFNQARQVAPCVIFLDEIDAVGRKRSMRANSSEERDQTLNQLLVEMDGFDTQKAIVVLAATNRLDMLDKALLRPGRFDRHITVAAPDRVGREAILKVHTRNTPLHADVILERIARITTGMTGADLANLVNEAALSAARQELDCLSHNCFEEALARVQLGALRPLVMDAHERRIIAIHESGHALVAYHLPEADTVNRVTILPRGQSLGVTQFTSEVDRYNYSRHTLMARIAVGLGGRVAEELTFGVQHVTTGAENDLQVVTDLARRMVTRWGMSEQVGVIFADHSERDYALALSRIDPALLPPQHTQARSLVADSAGTLFMNGTLSEQPQLLALSMPAPRSAHGVTMNSLIDAAVQHILNEGRSMARALLTAHSDQLALLSAALIEHEQLDRAQFEALLSV